MIKSINFDIYNQKLLLFYKKHSYLVYFFFYTVAFILTFFLCFYWFFKANKSFMWNVDGLYTHYNFLAYMGEYLREYAYSILHGDFTLPEWSFSFGYGSDIITTLYARFGDPLNYLSIFFPREQTELLHNFLAVLRIYLAGISFSIYCFYTNRRKFASLVGALIYCFCGLVLWVGLRHLYFMTPMIYFPLLVLGAEKIIRKEKPTLFILMIFLSALSNFYFFYMMTILVVILTLVFYFFNIEKFELKAFLQLLGKYIIYYLAGLGLAMFLFLPVVISYMNNARRENTYGGSLLFRNISYYLEFILRWFSQGSEYGEATGYSVLAVICIVALFLLNKTFAELKVKFIILTLFLLFPFFGYLLNGFGYVTNRWLFVYSFLVSYICTSVVPYLHKVFAKTQNKKILFAVCTIVLAGSLAFPLLSTDTFLAAIALLTIVSFAICVFLRNQDGLFNKVIIFILCICSLWVNGSYRFSPFKENYISEYVDSGTANEQLMNTPSLLVNDDSEFYRIDENDSRYNTSVAQNYAGLSFYTSLLDYRVDEFHQLLGVNNLPAATVYNYKGVNRRTFMESILSTKYYATSIWDTNIPYGFEKIDENETYSLYQNSNFLPLGFTYNSYITKEKFESLDLAQRQEALMQTIVLDDEINGFESAELNFTSSNPKFSMEFGEGVSLDGNSFVVTQGNAEVYFTYEGLPNSETYLNISGLNIETYSPQDIYSMSSHYEDDYVEAERAKYRELTTYVSLTLEADNFYNEYRFRTSEDNYYSGVRDYFMNMGYSENSRSWCKLSFSTPGTYTFDEINIVCQPMDNLSTYTEKLKENVLQNTVVTSRTIEGTIDVSSNKILYLSVPNNGGWTVYVDGKETDCINGNIMGIAIPLNKGSHSIYLEYNTPGLKLGIVISLFVAIVILCIVFLKILLKKLNLDTVSNWRKK